MASSKTACMGLPSCKASARKAAFAWALIRILGDSAVFLIGRYYFLALWFVYPTVYTLWRRMYAAIGNQPLELSHHTREQWMDRSYFSLGALVIHWKLPIDTLPVP